MKLTLLEMTQDILSSMSSDEVNSISDTVESLQVANILKQKYYDIVNRLDLTDHDQLLQLQPSIDPNIPVVMYIPTGVSDIKWIKYFDSNILDGNTTSTFAHDLNVDLKPLVNQGVSPPGYLYVTVLPNDQFIDMVTAFNPSDTNIFSYKLADKSNSFPNNFTFYARNDRQPIYCTILSNFYVLFDAYDSSQDSTLQASKTMMMGTVIPAFQLVDTFIPDLAEEQFPLLLNEAKSLAYYELKQQPHQLAMQEGQRGWSTIQKKKAVINRPTFFEELPGFGRKRGYYGFKGSWMGGYNNNRGGLY